MTHENEQRGLQFELRKILAHIEDRIRFGLIALYLDMANSRSRERTK